MGASKTQDIKTLMAMLKVLIVEDEPYSRKVVRTLLQAIGVTKIFEAKDGASGLQAIGAYRPDVVLLDWEMPGMNGAEFMRHVRSPSTFMYPAVPVIMLTGHSEKSRVMEAVNLGVHEFLVKPVSSTALLTRIVGVLAQPRPMIQRGAYYGPEPRKLSTYKPEFDQGISLPEVGAANDRSPSQLPDRMIFVD
ncbi:MAG: response regulator [Xanthobacteraceae bacterium]|nr:response regulator [Xanthobacteraceae bacterium]